MIPSPVNYTNTAEHCNLWRMYDDIQDSFDSVTDIVDWVGDNAPHNGMLQAAGPGHHTLDNSAKVLGFQNGANNRDLGCVLHPSTLRSRCWVQSTSRIHHATVFNAHF